MTDETIRSRELLDSILNETSRLTNGLALLVSVVALLVFALLPFVAFEHGSEPERRSYTGLSAGSTLGEATEGLARADIDQLGLVGAGDGGQSLLVAVPVLLVLAAGASLAALVNPKAAQVLRWLVLVGGGGVASVLLVWALSSAYSQHVQIAYWLLVAAGWFLAAQSFVPRTATAPRERGPRLGDAPVDAEPLAPSPLGIEPTMTFSAPTPAGFSAARPLDNLRPAVAWLVELRSGSRHPVYEGNTAIGRSRANDVVLEDLRVSREHALIYEENGSFTLYDRASAHGTMVNNHRLDGPVQLQNRVQIKVGGVVMQFILLDEAPSEDGA